jgi:hypothetical protein
MDETTPPINPSANNTSQSTPMGGVPQGDGVPPSTFTNMAPHDPAPARKSRRMLVVVLAIVVVLLLAGVAAYATFLRQTPEQKIKNAFAGMAEVNSFALDGNLTSNSGFTGTLNGQFDGNSESFNMQLAVSVVLNTVKLDMVGIKDTLYLKTDGLVEVVGGFLSIGQSDLAKIEQLLESKYIKISPEDSPGRLLGQEPSTTTPTTPQISDADKEKISKLVEDTEFFKVSEKLGNKDIKGTSAAGYKIVLQAEGLRQLMRGLRDIESLKPVFANQNQEEFDQALADVNQTELNKVPFEVWVSGDRVAQVALNIAEGQAQGRIELSFSRFDESFSIQAPTDSRPFSEVLPGLQSAFSEFNPGSSLLTPSTRQ